MEEKSLDSRKAERRPAPVFPKAVGEREDSLRSRKEAVTALPGCQWGLKKKKSRGTPSFLT